MASSHRQGRLPRSAMLERPRGFLRWLGRRLFDHIRLDPETEARLCSASERGLVVYVMRTRSLLDYLFFNHLFLKHRLPLAQFANGVDTQPLAGLGSWLSGVWRRLTGGAHEPDPAEQLSTVARQGKAALLFLRSRRLGARHRRAGPEFIEQLLAVQRDSERPILLLPQLIVWPRKPPSSRLTVVDIIFGDQEAPGRLRKLGHFIRHFRSATVQVGEPINLKEVLADHEAWTDRRVARKLRGLLWVHLAREAMAVHGPRVKPAATLRAELLGAPAFRASIEQAARLDGQSAHAAMDQARRHLRQIAAAWSWEMLLVLAWLLDLLFSRIYSGVEVDEAGLRQLKEAAKTSRTAPLVLVPCHKSHIDYLVISWMFLRHAFVPPHVAAGENLAFFPVGTILRRAGAFYMKRSFKGQEVYRAVFCAYLWKLVREGYPIEFYLEGGRSRTGKLLPPKLGMLGMLLGGLSAGAFRDLTFMPMHISYERVVEVAAYRRELTGGEKEAESVGGVVRASRVLRSRYGRVYVSFGEPVRLSAWLTRQEVEDPREQSAEALSCLTKRFGYFLMRRIRDASVITPSNVIATVLLCHDRRGMSGRSLRGQGAFLVSLLTRRGVRLSRSMSSALARNQAFIERASSESEKAGHIARAEALRIVFDEAIELKARAKLVERNERGGEAIYVVPDRARIELDYDRNALLGLLAPDCILATVLQAADRPVSREALAREAQKLSQWFQLEFIYDSGAFEENFAESLSRLVDDGLVELVDGTYRAKAPHILDFLRGALRHLVEGYWIAADALRTLAEGPMEHNAWIEAALEHLSLCDFLEGEIRRAEAASTAVLTNALELFRKEGLVERGAPVGKKGGAIYRLADGVTLDDIAFRRDDLGLLLV